MNNMLARCLSKYIDKTTDKQIFESNFPKHWTFVHTESTEYSNGFKSITSICPDAKLPTEYSIANPWRPKFPYRKHRHLVQYWADQKTHSIHLISYRFESISSICYVSLTFSPTQLFESNFPHLQIYTFNCLQNKSEYKTIFCLQIIESSVNVSINFQHVSDNHLKLR